MLVFRDSSGRDSRKLFDIGHDNYQGPPQVIAPRALYQRVLDSNEGSLISLRKSIARETPRDRYNGGNCGGKFSAENARVPR